jgi:hypothetical protein
MRKRSRLSHRAKIKARLHARRLKIRRLKRRSNFHREEYTKTMLEMYRDTNTEGRQKLENLFRQTTGQSLEQLYERRITESLLPPS